METLSEAATNPVPRASRPADLFDSEDGTISGMESLIERPKKKLFEIGINWDERCNLTSDGHDASSAEYESDCDKAAQGSSLFQLRGPSSATASALPLAMDIALDSLAGQKPLLSSQTSSGLPLSLADCQDLPISMLGEEAVTLIHNQSHSPVPSPEFNIASAATSLLLDFDELEDGGCITSSNTSLSPIDWELVDHDDAFKPNLH